MKRIIALALIIIQTALICACGSGSVSTAQTSKTTEISTSGGSAAEKTEIKNVSDFKKLNDVEKIKIGSFPYSGISLFKLTFISNGLSIRADLILPKGYEEGGMPIMVYAPNVYSVDNIKSICDEGICVVRLYSRGDDGSEGAKDLGGTDWVDIANLIDILTKAEFWQESKVILTGASEGSVRVLKAAAERPDLVDACAVIDIISDLGSYVEARGEAVKNLIDSMIGKTDDLEAEYAKRSAVTFADKIKCRTLIMSYKDSIVFPETQAEALINAISEAGSEYEHYSADAMAMDFMGATLHKLITFIKSVNGEPTENGGLEFTFKNGASSKEQELVIAEAKEIMANINAYLGISIADGIKIDCVFDPNYVNADGQIRSGCHYRDRIMYCVNYEDFVHEYIHMLLYFSEGGVYSSGDARIPEGAAMYICHLWESEINEKDFVYIKETGVREWSNAAEHETIVALLGKKELEYNNLNYNNAFMVMMCEAAGGVDEVLQSANTEFINYYLGFTVVDHIINECGGMDKFLVFYQDSSNINRFYGKSIVELSKEALVWNNSTFE